MLQVSCQCACCCRLHTMHNHTAISMQTDMWALEPSFLVDCRLAMSARSISVLRSRLQRPALLLSRPQSPALLSSNTCLKPIFPEVSQTISTNSSEEGQVWWWQTSLHISHANATLYDCNGGQARHIAREDISTKCCTAAGCVCVCHKLDWVF